MNWIEFSLSFSAIAGFFSRLSIVNFRWNRWRFALSLERVFQRNFRESHDETAKKWIFRKALPKTIRFQRILSKNWKKQLKKKPKQLEKYEQGKKKK